MSRNEYFCKCLLFFNRWLTFINNNGQDQVISNAVLLPFPSVYVKTTGHNGEVYEYALSIKDNEEFTIKHNGQDIFDYLDLDEYGLTEEDINYFKNR